MQCTLTCYFPAKNAFVPVEIRSDAFVGQVYWAILGKLNKQGIGMGSADICLRQANLNMFPAEGLAHRALNWVVEGRLKPNLDPMERLFRIFPNITTLPEERIHIIVCHADIELVKALCQPGQERNLNDLIRKPPLLQSSEILSNLFQDLEVEDVHIIAFKYSCLKRKRSCSLSEHDYPKVARARLEVQSNSGSGCFDNTLTSQNSCLGDKQYQALHQKFSEAIIHNNLGLPAVSKLLKYGTQDVFLNFQIKCYYPLHRPFQQLYLATTDEGSSILIKFSQTYSIELHQYCFEKGHAPELLAFESLAGGWHGIAMEYLADAAPIRHIPHHTEKQLKDLVDAFHEEGLVHGDLRDANILSAGDHFFLIDFDWGGKDGEAEYPTLNLTLELRAGRKYEDLKIRKEDDKWILDITLLKHCSIIS